MSDNGRIVLSLFGIQLMILGHAFMTTEPGIIGSIGLLAVLIGLLCGVLALFGRS